MANNWETFFDAQGEIGGIQDSEGRMIVKFNYYDTPVFRAALAKNILWTRGCIEQDAKREKVTFRDRWRKLFRKNES